MNYENLTIEKVFHDCIKIKGSKIIYFDPLNIPVDSEQADLIFITHPHTDHCSPEDLKKIVSPNTIIVTVADCQSKISDLEFGNLILVEPGKKYEVLGFNIETVAAYNVNKWRAPGIPYHPKENEWVGFILEIDGKRIYHTGDTDVISEMQNISNIDVILIPISGTYVLTVDEAVQVCNIIKPKLAIPMHYGFVVGTVKDAEQFKEKAGCKVEII